jgi:hypothetical protein
MMGQKKRSDINLKLNLSLTISIFCKTFYICSKIKFPTHEKINLFFLLISIAFTAKKSLLYRRFQRITFGRKRSILQHIRSWKEHKEQPTSLMVQTKQWFVFNQREWKKVHQSEWHKTETKLERFFTLITKWKGNQFILRKRIKRTEN